MGILDQLTGTSLNDLTQAQIATILDNVTISPTTRADLSDAALVLNAFQARQGTIEVDANAGQIAVNTLTPATSTQVFQPSAGQVFQIIGMEIENTDAVNAATVTINFFDGTNTVLIHTESLGALGKKTIDFGSKSAQPIYITNSLYIQTVQSGEATDIEVSMANQIIQR